ncbi:MAG: hypothetical protein NVSMB5_08930 [Candidatus Velthaea sp.]
MLRDGEERAQISELHECGFDVGRGGLRLALAPAGNGADMNSGDSKRCDNLACLCQVALADTVCSPACDTPESRDPATITCRCGHAGCKKQMEEQLHGGIGRESL